MSILLEIKVPGDFRQLFELRDDVKLARLLPGKC
jgi:hypothetical protein